MAWLVAEQGWRTAFVIVAPLGFVVSALWWWYARDYPEEHPAINKAEVKLIGHDREAPVLMPINPPGWVRILKDRNVILLTASYFCSNFVFYSTFSWFFYYAVTVRNFDAGTAGYVTSSQWIAGAAGGVLNTGANAMGVVNALLVPWIATTFSWQAAIGSGAIFSILALVLLMLVRPDETVDLF